MANPYTFKDGITSAIPVSFGYMSIGAAFGVVAVAQGFSIWQVFCLSFFLYAGSGQFIIVAMMAVKAPITLITLTIFLVNFRMFLQSLTATQAFPDQSLKSGLAMGTLMTDESFGVLVLEQTKQTPITVPWMHGVNLTGYLSWGVATLLGAALGKLIPNPQQFGLDFALATMFIGLFILTLDAMLQHDRLKVVLIVLIATASIYYVAGRFTSSYVAVLIATILGALIGALMTGPTRQQIEKL